MESYDVFMLVVLAGAMAFGAWKGLVWQAASLGAILLSTFMATNFSGPVAEHIAAQEPWNRYAAMAIVYVATTLAVWIGFQWISGGVNRLKLRTCDRQLGALLGLAKGSVICLLITLFGVTMSNEQKRQAILRSFSGQFAGKVARSADQRLPEGMRKMLGPHLAGVGRYFDPAADVERISTQSAMKLANMSMGEMGGLEKMSGDMETEGTNSALPFGQSQLQNLLRAVTEASQRQRSQSSPPATPETLSNPLSGASPIEQSAPPQSAATDPAPPPAAAPASASPRQEEEPPKGMIVNPHF